MSEKGLRIKKAIEKVINDPDFQRETFIAIATEEIIKDFYRVQQGIRSNSKRFIG